MTLHDQMSKTPQSISVFEKLLLASEKISLLPAGGSNSAAKAIIFTSSLNEGSYVSVEMLIEVL